MVGIDLHSNNMFCGMVNRAGQKLYGKKLACHLPAILTALEPFKEQIDTIAVESTYNWYWLVDGLQDHGYRVVLANPAAIVQYEGIKRTDDESDGFFLAELLRLNILPQGYICDRDLRPVRDLLRRRLGLVRKRTSLMLSLKGLHARMFGQPLALKRVKSMSPEEGAQLFSHAADQLIAEIQVRLMRRLDEDIGLLETKVLEKARTMPCYELLQTLPGVGKIMALTITLETADITRFACPGQYASYCRCVDSQRTSNRKKKGTNNVRCGNGYLSWAWVEVANFARRFDDPSRRFHDRKTAQANSILATKALACKLSKAAWHIMTENKPYDPERLFPSAQKSDGCWGDKMKEPILDGSAQPCLSPGTSQEA